ncbi:YfiR family protein [Saccharicrinis aurantiacus]|uniref:YfiR family protein n=1 Tax=Saccharicrinis aurantiacus TaxID=1849719 RepID=UPI00095026DE|nr:YfiR family protein [Saccharicrinis aurantiacus]
MKKKISGIVLGLFVLFNVSGQMQIERIEASYIANFMRYVKWPNQESLTTLKFGVYGKGTAIFKELGTKLDGKNVGTAIIKVVEISDEAEFSGCQLLFIPNGKSYKAKKALKAMNSAVLIITEEQDFHPDYSIINFKVINSKLAFQLRNNIAEERKISISSRLQQMAAQ